MTGSGRLRRGARRKTLGVSLRASLQALGRILEIFSLAFALPALVAAAYLESPLPFLIPLVVGLVFGFALERTNRGKGRIGTREAFFVVALDPQWHRQANLECQNKLYRSA